MAQDRLTETAAQEMLDEVVQLRSMVDEVEAAIKDGKSHAQVSICLSAIENYMTDGNRHTIWQTFYQDGWVPEE